MSDTKWTPGPWEDKGLNGVIGSNGEKVVMSRGPAFGSKSHFKSAEHNSNLIMEATNLYEALKDATDMLEELMMLPEIDVGTKEAVGLNHGFLATLNYHMAKARGEHND